jgi:hypothetical protein
MNNEYKELNMTINNGKDEVTVFVYEGRVQTYYCQEGASMICMTYDELLEGEDLDAIKDHDVMSFAFEIDTIDEFEEALCF